MIGRTVARQYIYTGYVAYISPGVYIRGMWRIYHPGCIYTGYVAYISPGVYIWGIYTVARQYYGRE
jgi:hypothetical protein